MGKVIHITKEQLKLVEAIKNNETSALEKLYSENYRKAEVFILKNSGSVSEAKDVYQEAFLATYQNIKKEKYVPQNSTALQGYLYQIVKNKWLDVLRSSKFKKTTSIADDFQIAQTEEEHYDTTPDTNQQKLIEAFKILGQECKQLLEAFYFEKKSLRTLAAQFNIEEASARNKKYRCIQKLKELTNSPSNK